MCCWNVLEMFRKVPCIDFWYLKYLILDQFCVPFCPKVSEQDFSKKAYIILQLNGKDFNFQFLKASTFHKTWKSSILVHVWHFWPKTPRTRFFFQKNPPPLFKLMTACVKIRRFLRAVLEKNSGQMDKDPEDIS